MTLTQMLLAAAFPLIAVIGTPVSAASLGDQVDDVHQRYEQATVAGDAAGIAALFAEDGALLPLTGGNFAGHDAILAAAGALRPGALDIVSTDVDMIGDFAFDTGTFAITLPAEAGGQTIMGEYVAVLSTGDDMKIQRLVVFPARLPPQQ